MRRGNVYLFRCKWLTDGKCSLRSGRCLSARISLSIWLQLGPCRPPWCFKTRKLYWDQVTTHGNHMTQAWRGINCSGCRRDVIRYNRCLLYVFTFALVNSGNKSQLKIRDIWIPVVYVTEFIWVLINALNYPAYRLLCNIFLFISFMSIRALNPDTWRIMDVSSMCFAFRGS